MCNHGRVRRWLIVLIATLSLGLAAVSTPVTHADYTPWFAPKVGNATQVISVVGDGGSSAKVDVFARTAAGWQPVRVGIPAFVGSNGMAPQTHDGQAKTPMGIFTLDFAFGTAPNPGGGLKYVQVGPNHWWDGDMKSPTYNTMQVCEKSQCPFNTDPASGTENLEIPAVRARRGDGREQGTGARQRRRLLLARDRRRADRGMRGDRGRHPGRDHALACSRARSSR